MVQAMDHEAVKGDMDQEAVKGDMDQEAVEGAMVGASDGWYKQWITKQSKELSTERWMVQAMEGAIDGTSYGSRSSRRSCQRSDGWCKRWKEQ
jgi:hypothetical protein